MPLFKENEEVTIDKLSVTPHVITTIDAEDKLPVYSTFISHETVKGKNLLFNICQTKTEKFFHLSFIRSNVAELKLVTFFAQNYIFFSWTHQICKRH